MDFLSNVPLALFQSFLFFLIAKIILDIKYTVRDYLIILAIIIPSTFLY
ncbi:ATP-binding protein, partial [Staphylococcus hominis]